MKEICRLDLNLEIRMWYVHDQEMGKRTMSFGEKIARDKCLCEGYISSAPYY